MTSPGPSLASRIAETLRQHVRIRYDDAGTPWCECGVEWNINDGHAAHVAEVVAAVAERWWAVREVELVGQVTLAKMDLQSERRHSDNWQRLAGHYDDIRYALRNAPDNPAGHAEFYQECAALIFGPEPFSAPPGGTDKAEGLFVAPGVSETAEEEQ